MTNTPDNIRNMWEQAAKNKPAPLVPAPENKPAPKNKPNERIIQGRLPPTEPWTPEKEARLQGLIGGVGRPIN